MKKQITSPGKLILFGEYSVVFDGLSLVLPLKFSQLAKWEKIEQSENLIIKIKSIQKGSSQPFFENEYNLKNDNISCVNNCASSLFFQNLIETIQKKHSNKLLSTEIEFNFNFNPKFGFGSSSASIKNICSIFNLDPWEIYYQAVNGSGADLAATYFKPGEIFSFRKKDTEMKKVKVEWEEIFNQSLFVYLNQKEDSARSIKKIKQPPDPNLINQIDSLIDQLIQTKQIKPFQKLMKEHEELVAKINHLTPVQEKLFQDFPGQIKSLGAWGGDFIWALAEQDIEQSQKHFADKGFKTMYTYRELVE